MRHTELSRERDDREDLCGSHVAEDTALSRLLGDEARARMGLEVRPPFGVLIAIDDRERIDHALVDALGVAALIHRAFEVERAPAILREHALLVCPHVGSNTELATNTQGC